MKTIQPFGDRVLIKPVDVPQQTASGLYLPDTSREGPGEGEIVAIGEGSPLQEKLSIGDQILFQKFSGTEIKMDGVTFVLLAEADILGRVVEVDQLSLAAAEGSAVGAR